MATESDGKDSDAVDPEESNVEVDDYAAGTIEKSRSRFSKRNQLRADGVRRLQHADAFPESDTMSHATQTNGLFSNPISKRDIDAYNDVLGKSKCISQGKRTMRSSDPISVDHQLIELPPTMKKTI